MFFFKSPTRMTVCTLHALQSVSIQTDFVLGRKNHTHPFVILLVHSSQYVNGILFIGIVLYFASYYKSFPKCTRNTILLSTFNLNVTFIFSADKLSYTENFQIKLFAFLNNFDRLPLFQFPYKRIFHMYKFG